jgi:threonine aldolase
LAPHCNDQALNRKQKKYFHQFYGTWELRIVTHLDYREVMHTYVLETLSKLESVFLLVKKV